MPMPTWLPQWNFLPRCRIMMLPGITRSLRHITHHTASQQRLTQQRVSHWQHKTDQNPTDTQSMHRCMPWHIATTVWCKPHSPSELLDTKPLARAVSAVRRAAACLLRSVSHTQLHASGAVHRSSQTAVLRKCSQHCFSSFTTPCNCSFWLRANVLFGQKIL